MNRSRELILVVIYLPPDSGSTEDALWHSELDGLDDDMMRLSEQGSHPCVIDYVIMGDFNHQPLILGSKGFRNMSRENHLMSFLKKWSSK